MEHPFKRHLLRMEGSPHATGRILVKSCVLWCNLMSSSYLALVKMFKSAIAFLPLLFMI